MSTAGSPGKASWVLLDMKDEKLKGLIALRGYKKSLDAWANTYAHWNFTQVGTKNNVSDNKIFSGRPGSHRGRTEVERVQSRESHSTWTS